MRSPLAASKMRTIQQSARTGDEDLRVDLVFRAGTLVARCHVQLESGDREVVEIPINESALNPGQQTAVEAIARALHAEAVTSLGFT